MASVKSGQDQALKNKAVSVASDTLLDVRGAAIRLACNERFVRRLVQERRIPFFKVGGSKVRFSSADLDRWLDGQKILERR